jgi:hypothetical protein
VFETKIDVTAGEPARKSEIAGTMAIPLDGCRGVSIDLSGPIRSSETRPGAGKPYTVACEGKIALSIRSQAAR